MTIDTEDTSLNVISSDNVEGTTVYNPQGEKLGSIHSVVIDKVSGQVRYAVLQFGGFLGIGADHYPLPWDQLSYDVSLGGYVVPLAKDRLENAPHYAAGQAPEYTTEYGRRVYDHYGSTWYL